MIKTISFLVNIQSASQLITKPTRQNIVNSFDYNGSVVGVNRLPNEGNVDLRNKIFDASVHPAGPTYDGIINSLTRAFGFIRTRVIKIELKAASSGSVIATAPRVDFLADKVVLYKNWDPNSDNNIIDKEIDIYSPDDAGYYLSDLIAEINTSECYTCSLVDSIRTNTHSTSLVRGTSHKFISVDNIYMDYKTNLANQNIIPNTLIFDDKNTFSTEVFTTPTASGEFYVDYINGIITTFAIPKIETKCSYHYNVFPFFVDYSPIQIFSMNDENFRDKLYNKETLDSGDLTNGLLNKEGQMILEEIYKSNVFWGE